MGIDFSIGMISFKGGIDAKAAVDEKREVGRIVMTEEGFGSPDVEKRAVTRFGKLFFTDYFGKLPG